MEIPSWHWSRHLTGSPVKVAIVYDVLYPWTIGGVEKRYWEIARRLPRFGIEPHLFGPKYWDGPQSIQREGVWLHGVGKPRPLYVESGGRTFAEPILYALELIPALLRVKVDLVDCCIFPFFPWFSARAVSALRGVPILTTTPEFWGAYWLSYLGSTKGTVARLIERLATQTSTDIVCLSPFTAGRLRSIVDSSVPITPVPAGIDAPALAKFAAPPNNRNGIVVVSRLIPHKRVDDAIQAFAQVQPTHPDCDLTIVGRGPEKIRLRDLAQTLGLADGVTFRSGLDEDALYTLIGSSRCLVLPSEREGQGLVVVEAQAVGTPVVVAKAPESAATDFVTDGLDGLLYPVGDVTALATKLNLLVDNQAEWCHVATHGFQSAARLDWDTEILPRMAALYRSTLHDCTRRSVS